MYNGFGVNYKKLLQEDLAKEMRTYIDSKGLTDVLGLPLLGFAFADDKRFMDAFNAGITKHPKEIYRPGTTVIVSFLPFNPDYVKDNFAENSEKCAVSDSWTFAYERSIITSAHINTFILDFLDGMGREASLSTIHTDWDKETHRPEWSHKIAANIAGMGEFGPNSCIRTEYGPWGRFNSIITELKLDTSGKDLNKKLNDELSSDIRSQETSTDVGLTEEELEDEINIVEDYLTFSLFENPLRVPKRLIDSCPCGAIDDSGIDRKKCQQYCDKLNEFIPEPDACGKCYSR